jgi:glucose-1-phosphate adenylyltransferase
MLRALALILAGGQGTRLSILSQKRAKPAVPFAGKYRIIDFTLSNCANSGVTTVGILTQYRPRSLNDHIRNGRPWDLDRMSGGVTLLQPYQVAEGDQSWYRGTAEAVHLNLDFVLHHRPTMTLVLSGDHVYKMDYGQLLRYHESNQADLTACVVQVPLSEAPRYGIVTLSADEPGRVVRFTEKPRSPENNLASMGVYCFSTDILRQLLAEDAQDERSRHDFGGDVLPKMIREGYRVFGYVFDQYWIDAGTVQAYWEAHMDLLDDDSPLDLQARDWIIHTRSEERPPVNLRTGASVGHCLISDGCIIEGAAEYSVLSPGVHIKPGAIVRNSIIMTDTTIDEMAVVDRTIADKNVRIGARAQVGVGDDMEIPNETDPRLTTGITLIGKNAVVPPGTSIGRNCIVTSDTLAQAFTSRVIPSGRTVGVIG